MSDDPLVTKKESVEEYLCESCDAKFFYMGSGELQCPECGTKDPDFLIPLSEIEEDDERS